MKPLWMMVLAAGLAIVPAGAFAEDSSDPPAGLPAPAPEAGDKPYDVELNGGVVGYTGRVGNHTSAGVGYGITGAYNPNPLLSYEIAYQGNTNGIDNSDRKITSNILQGDVKFGPQLGGPFAWRPFVFAGLGLDFVNSGNNDFGLTNALQLEIPLGIGAELFTNKVWRVGARGTYNFAPGIGGAVSPEDAHPDRWGAQLTAQAAF